ncbi:MAG: addiction module protein [Deltaproteobacteria bacterium]|nr:addiction module protein [Deltaproteobacteria bacterium]
MFDQEEDDDLSPAEWQTAWTKEIRRRLSEIRSDKVKLIAGDEVFRRVRERHRLVDHEYSSPREERSVARR